MVNTGLHCSAPSCILTECECGDACSHRSNAFIELQLILHVYSASESNFKLFKCMHNILRVTVNGLLKES